MTDLMLGLLLSFFAVVAVVPILSKVAEQLNLIDNPGGRKQHDNEIPLIGGVAIFYTFLILSFTDIITMPMNWTLYTGIVFLLCIGIMDDLNEINVWFKFFVHIFVALLIVMAGGANLIHLGHLFGDDIFYLGYMSVPFCVAAVVLLMNAMNLSDGLDGLAGGQSLIIFSWMAFLMHTGGEHDVWVTLMLLIGAIAAFLVYNMRHPFRDHAGIFLGDAGSITLGFVIGFFAIHSAKDPAYAIEPITIAWILALPIFDTCAQFFRRACAGKHPFTPDRGHFHHHFIAAGWSVRAAVYAILVLSIICGAFGVFAPQLGVPIAILTWAWIVLLLLHMAVSLKPSWYVKILEKPLKRAEDRPKASEASSL